MKFYETFLSLCNSNNMAPTKIAIENNISKASVCRWKHGSMPSDATVKKLADYFGVSVAYLKGEEKETVTNDGDGLHAEVIDLFSGLPDDQKQAALSYLQYLANKK